MNKSVVITGIGMIIPGAEGKDDAWKFLRSGKGALKKLTRFKSNSNGWFAGEVDNFNPDEHISKRLSRKIDRFSQLALASAGLAIEDASLDLASTDRNRVGVFVGNCFGGWEFTDRELRNLHTQGVREVSPFQATAWFPAAPQGQITIVHDLHGFSKTIVADRASGLASIAGAFDAIKTGRCDVVIAGGTEAQITPFAYTACVTEGLLAMGTPQHSAGASYRPFDRSANGLIPGEGAVFLVIEEKSHAQRRNARIYAEIRGTSTTNDACFPNILPVEERGLSRAMCNALKDSNLLADEIDFLVADAIGTRQGDLQEVQAIQKVFGSGNTLRVTTPKPSVGHLYGAAGALDVAVAALALHEKSVPPISNINRRQCDCDLNLVEELEYGESIEAAMVNARGTGGINVSMVLSG